MNKKLERKLVSNISVWFQLNSYLVKEKLPQESAHLQQELNIMQTIATEQHPTRSDLILVQDKVGNA